MKIGKHLAAALPTPASHAAAHHKADAWQAQLERAWLDSWQGDRPERQHAANPDATASASPTPAVRSDRPAPANLCERRSDERDSLQPKRFNHSPIHGSHEGDPPTAALRRSMALHIEAPAGTTHDRASRPGQRAEASLPASAARLAQPLTHGRDDEAPSAQAEAQQGAAFDHAPGPMPARSALQVAVTDDTAQVTLRDATLSSSEAVRLPQAIAHQLLESGLASVRLYVNGRLSQHDRRDHSTSRQRILPGIGSTDSLHINPLERK